MTLPFTSETVILAGAGLIILLLVIWLVSLERKLRRLTAGADGASLEKVIHALVDQVKATDEVNEEIKDYLRQLDARLKKSVQHVKTIRFNPFPDQGGNQSFAIAWLNEEGDGTVLSSLYARDRVSVFAKPVKARQSEFELSREEQASLTK
jgi:hypothetical protein